MSVKQNLFVSVFVHKCLMMLNDVEYTTFKMFVTQMSNYLFVISFQLMFYKTLHYRLARALTDDVNDDYLAEEHLPLDSPVVDDDTKLIPLDTNLPVSNIKRRPTTSDFSPHEELEVNNKDFLAVELPIIDNETIFEAEKILDTRVRQDQCQYLIKWVGYHHSQNTREPEGNIFDLQSINEFEDRQHV